MYLAYILKVCRTNLSIYLESSVSMAKDCFGTAYPWIVVTEDSSVFLISWRVGRHFPQVQMVVFVCRLEKYDSILGIQVFLHAFQCFFSLAVFNAYSGHYTHTLRLDEYLAVIA